MLTSQLFAGNALLEAIAADRDRISRERHPSDPAVQLIQTALLHRDQTCLPVHGADGQYGDETAAAVVRFKVDVLGVDPASVIDDVGPRTAVALDQLERTSTAPAADDLELRYNDRKSHYTNVALQKANDASHPSWEPELGFPVNRARIVDVYAYYRDLALARPEEFLWAGLGHMAGGAVVGGLASVIRGDHEVRPGVGV